jgi:hypothetical protein
MFSCDTLPADDEDVDMYSCGSEELDTALFFWCIMVVILCVSIFLAVYLAWHNWTSSSDTLFRADFKEKSVLRRIEMLARNHNFYAGYLQTLEGSSGALLRLFRFNKEVCVVTRYLCGLAVVCIVTTLPLIVLKIIHHGRADGGAVMTHSHLYTWLPSLAYLTGEQTAVWIVTAWVFVIVAFSVIVLKLQQQALSEEKQIRDNASSDVFRPYVAQTNRILEGKAVRMLGVLAVNFFIVGTVNYVYIRLLSGNTLTPFMILLLQISLAVFKVGYSVFCVPLLCMSIKDRMKSIWLRMRIYLLNSIIIPILISMRSSPKCIEGLFDSDDPVGSVYSYDDCVSVLYSLATGITTCSSYERSEVEVAALVPPFIYRYQCSSVLLTSYIPVFIYTYLFHLMLPFSIFVMSCISYTTIPSKLRTKFPGIFWPDHWVTNEADRLTFGESEAVEREVAGVATGRKLINIKTIVTQMVHHMCVLLTFGMCSPLLALVVITSIVVTSDLLRMLLARFVHYRMEALLCEEKKACASLNLLDTGSGAGAGQSAGAGGIGSRGLSSAALEQAD